MSYCFGRRTRCGGFFLSRRTNNLFFFLIFLVSLISLCTFYLSIISPEIPKKVLSLKLWSNESRFKVERHFKWPWNCSCGFGSGASLATERDATSTTTERSKAGCLNHRQLVNFSSVGWTNFSLIMPHVEPNIPCEERRLFIVVVVNSAADERHRILRKAIRKTWGNLTEGRHKYKWRIYFALGMSSSYAMNQKNRQEAIEYKDIIIGNFPDIYKNIVIKTFMSHFWAYSRFDCKYVMKTDDDVYVRVPRLIKWLERQGFPQPFYGGFLNQFPVVFRNPKSQWFVSREEFNETRWPPFSHGAFQVVSTAILPRCFNYTQFRRPFTTDDAYFGVMARDLGVNATQIPGFSLKPPKTDCEFMMAIAFGHAIGAPSMFKYHARYHTLFI